MVQVDVFWSYGIGAGLALAAHKQLSKSSDSNRPFSIWDSIENPFFTKTLLFLAIIFVPSGIWLLWQFPSWETMHVGDRNLPVWLVGLFSITNITQGVLAFTFCHWLIISRRKYLAYLQFYLGYFGMFFILVHGWDGIGYQRFFSASPEQLQGWTWSTAASWFTSDVALTLYGMGVILIPTLVGMVYRWNGRRQGAKGFLLSIFVGSLGSAIICSYMIHQLGLALGVLSSMLFLLLILHPSMPFLRRFYDLMVPDEAGSSAPMSRILSSST